MYIRFDVAPSVLKDTISSRLMRDPRPEAVEARRIVSYSCIRWAVSTSRSTLRSVCGPGEGGMVANILADVALQLSGLGKMCLIV